jgi:hypothetical protein
VTIRYGDGRLGVCPPQKIIDPAADQLGALFRMHFAGAHCRRDVFRGKHLISELELCYPFDRKTSRCRPRLDLGHWRIQRDVLAERAR